MPFSQRLPLFALLLVSACDCGAPVPPSSAATTRGAIAQHPPPALAATQHSSPGAGTHRAGPRADFDGNGFADIVVSQTDGPPPNDVGEIYYVDGQGIAATPTQRIAAGGSCGLGSTPPLRLGDINGDGFGDLAVPMPQRSGAVLIYLGSAAGLSVPPSATITRAGSPVGSCFGDALAVGDVDGDGKQDLIVGAPLENGDTGRVFVYRGDGHGFEDTAAFTLEAPEGSGSRFGQALDSCDMNGDGHDDVLIGAPWLDGHRGRGYVFSVTPQRELTRVAAVGAPSAADNSFWEMGEHVVAVRGPNRCDAVFIANGVSLHAGYVVASGSALSAPTSLTLPVGANGITSTSTGDVDGDGLDDLVLSSEGSVALYHGARNGIVTIPWVAVQTVGARGWGAYAAIPGDIDGDGLADLVIGDREHAHVYFGAANGVRNVPTTLSPQLDTEMGRARWVR